MKTLQNDFTTPEQSKRLLELGVPADSADCYYEKPDNLTEKWEYQCHIGECIAIKQNLFSYRNGYVIPCWSVGRLMEICKVCESKNDYEQLCDEMKYSEDVMELTISHIKDNLPIIDFSKLEE